LENFCIVEEYPTKPFIEQIRTDHLSHFEREKLLHLIKKFKNIFYNENSNLSFTNAIKHIRITDDVPIQAKTYRYPYIHKKEIKTQI